MKEKSRDQIYTSHSVYGIDGEGCHILTDHGSEARSPLQLVG